MLQVEEMLTQNADGRCATSKPAAPDEKGSSPNTLEFLSETSPSKISDSIQDAGQLGVETSRFVCSSDPHKANGAIYGDFG
jgi:hypothetical protein